MFHFPADLAAAILRVLNRLLISGKPVHVPFKRKKRFKF